MSQPLPGERPLKRVPFTVEDERMIASMAGWMRFIGLFTAIVSIIGLVLTLATGALAVMVAEEMIRDPQATFSRIREGVNEGLDKAEVRDPTILDTTTRTRDRINRMDPEEIAALLKQNRWGLYGLLLLGVVTGILGTASGYYLYKAGEDFRMVAETDVADQGFLSIGLDRTKVFFQIQVANAVIGMLVVSAALISYEGQRGAFDKYFNRGGNAGTGAPANTDTPPNEGPARNTPNNNS